MNKSKGMFQVSKTEDEAIVRLICFPSAGATSSSFNSWRTALPDWIELIKVQLPGRAGAVNEAAHRKLDDLLPELVAQLEGFTDKPLACYGHSMGALLAFEIVRQLRLAFDVNPVALFVSGRRAPHLAIPENERLYVREDDELIDRLVSTGGETAALLEQPKWARFLLPSIRADLSISDQYCAEAGATVDCPLFAFLGEDDGLIPRAAWESWQDVAGALFQRHVYPGTHFFSPDGQAQLINKIVSMLEVEMACRLEYHLSAMPT